MIKQWRFDLEEETMQGETEEQGDAGETIGPFDSGTMDTRRMSAGRDGGWKLVITQNAATNTRYRKSSRPHFWDLLG